MNTPVRLQLSRRKGFSLQALSMSTNGLEAASVARPGRWGNPYVVGPDMPAAEAVALFREHLSAVLAGAKAARVAIMALRGKNLACWCRPGEPCHADVLLELANRENPQ